jgi:hypothetical protein
MKEAGEQAEEEAGGARPAAADFNFKFSSGRGEVGLRFVVEGHFTFFSKKQNSIVNNSLYFVSIITSKNL